jgi:hypothetical protein
MKLKVLLLCLGLGALAGDLAAAPGEVRSVATPGWASLVHGSGAYAYATVSSPKGGHDIIDLAELGTAPQAPSVSLALNQTQFQAGDTLQVTLNTTPGSDDPWDVYVALILPGFSPLFMTYAPTLSFSLTPVPARPTTPLGEETITILALALPSGLPAGAWQWAAVLARPDLSKLSEIAVTTCVFNDTSSDVGGSWRVRETIRGNCRGVSYPQTEEYTIDVVQTGSQLSVTFPARGVTVTGSIIEGQMAWQGDLPQDGGTLAVSFFGTIAADGRTMTGTAPWSWTDGAYLCSGTTEVFAERL